MTLHRFDTAILADSQLPGYTTVMQPHISITINVGTPAAVSVSSALAGPTQGDDEPAPTRIALGTGAHDTAQIDDLISDADEFTSVPSATVVVPVTGDPGAPAVQANGTGNGHTNPIG
jgi:hypothetical protein